MSRPIRWLTAALLLLPVGLALAAAADPARALAVPAALVAALYAVVWLGARPSRFEVSERGLELVFPVWRRTIRAGNGLRARLVSAAEFRREFGLPLRIGVGGLWGGFGWLWTTRRGLVEFYVSRSDELVLVERDLGRPLLVTPQAPEAMVQSLAGGAAGRA
jgi:hypothetical protein